MVKGALYVIISAALWGLGGVAGQYLYMHKVLDPFWLVMVRQTVAGVVFLCWARFINKENPWQVLKGEAKTMVFFSFAGVLGAQLGFYYTISICNAATATILQYTAPIMILIWALWKEHRRPEVIEILGIVGAFGGVFLISTHGRLDALTISGLALFTGLLSAVSYAFYSIIPAQLLKRHSTAMILGWGQIISGLSLVVVANPFAISDRWTIYACLAFGYLLIGATICSFAIYMQGLRIIGPVKASLISCAEPLTSIIAVVLLLDTVLTVHDYIGMACIIGVVVMLSVPRK